MKMNVVSVEKIWDRAPHNGLTDLIEFQGNFLCCFREGMFHAGDKGNGIIRILKSKDGRQWKSIAVLKKNGLDLRDPHFSLMPDGRLLLTLGGSLYRKGQYTGCIPQVSISDDSVRWTPVTEIPLPNEWIWRITWHKKIGYGFSYRLTDPLKKHKPWILTLFKTKDGLRYTPIKTFTMRSHPSEAAIRFLKDDTMVALLRRRGSAWIGSSLAPYKDWKWKNSGHYIGGPNFIVLPDGSMIAGGRDVKGRPNEKMGYTIGKMALGKMTLRHYSPSLILPSRGDCSYPGFVYRDGILYVSYYSSHEGKAAIYFAEVK